MAFIHHLGIASLNLGFGGRIQGGVYHSIYDDFEWFKRFGDPEFKFGKALAQVTVTSLLRLADAPVLPFEFGNWHAPFAPTRTRSKKRRDRKWICSP